MTSDLPLALIRPDVVTDTGLPVLMAAPSFPSHRGDWKSVFIRHLAEALAARDDVHLSLWAPPGECSPHIRRVGSTADAAMLQTLMDEGGLAHLLRNRPLRAIQIAARTLASVRAVARTTPAAVYHINWLQTALSLPRDHRPLVISVLGADLHLLRLPGMRQSLRFAFRGREVMLCPNAQWMLPVLEAAFGDIAKVRFVPLGIDPMWFQVQRTALPRPAKWLAVARLTHDKLGELLSWGETCFGGQERELHLFGPMQEQIELPKWVKYHGSMSPDALCTRWFPTATGLITLSRHAEGRPQVMLEAMAAGLPVLASDISAHADFVEHNRTGMLCADDRQLESLLLRIEQPKHNARIAHAARAWAHSAVGTWDDCAARYVAVYQELFGRLHETV